jgi:hypothetical protein
MVPAGLRYLIHERRIHPVVLEEMGVYAVDAPDGRGGRVYFPYRDMKGRQTWNRYRTWPEKSYRPERAGGRMSLYNVKDSTKPVVLIAEGEIDTLSLLSCLKIRGTSCGVVGVPGANTFQPSWRWLFAGSGVRVVYDGDEAGRKASLELRRILREATSDVEVISLPDNEDVNSLWVKGELERWIGGLG